MKIAYRAPTRWTRRGVIAVIVAEMGCAASAGPATKGSGGGAAAGTTGGVTAASSSGGGDGLSFTTSSNSGSSGGLGCMTTVSGTIFDPAGKLPLYDVVVYVPSTPLSPIAEGAACETCDGYFSGKPIVAAALSDAAGKFTMDVSALSTTTDVPLVVQVGKWRRAVTIPSVKACSDNPIDASLTRLPRNQSEGNLPKIAMARGGSDALECLIRKLGVDDSEFTTDSGAGRVHLYYIAGGTATTGTAQMTGGVALSPTSSLYQSLDKMKGYDIIMMACPGSDNVIDDSPLSDFLNVRAYADQGGRIFGSHYNAHYIWASKDTPNNPYPDVVKFSGSAHGFASGFIATGMIDTSFPKGKAMSDWLVNTGGSTVAGQMPIAGGEHSVDAVVNANAQSWITTTDDKGHTGVVEYFSFPTPIDGAACGRMVMSDLHVSSGTGDSGKTAFPDGCKSTDLSPQEKALAFMFFDLASCVQPETSVPTVPPLK